MWNKYRLIDQFKTAASRYKIEEGTVWLYCIESKTAEMLGISINPLVIPEGAYICIFPKEEELEIMGPKLFLKKTIAYDKGIGGQLQFIVIKVPCN